MLDSEFRLLLKKEYGFRENHLVLLDYFFKKKDAPLSAEELWKSTDVPRGRVYDFLNELVDWGFLEVEYGKPKTYKLREVKKALQSAMERRERRLTEVEKKTIEISNRLQRLWTSEIDRSEVRLLGSAQEYYLKLREMVLGAMEIKLMVRKPALFLFSERDTAWKRRYYEALTEKVNANQLKLQYLFSCRSLERIALEKENRDLVIKEMTDWMKNKNIDAKSIFRAPSSSTFWLKNGRSLFFKFLCITSRFRSSTSLAVFILESRSSNRRSSDPFAS